MRATETLAPPGTVPAVRVATGAAITLLVAIIGLFIVKWSPYYAKTFTAAAHHSLGNSILTGTSAAPPTVGWAAAWGYARAYFLAIWQALLLALLLGACIQVLLPTRWIARHLRGTGLQTSTLAAAMTLSGMMCTCCVAPVVVGLRKQRAAAGAAMGIFVGNPTLNPAVLLFIGFVLSWPFALLRLVIGLALVVTVAIVAGRLAGERSVDAPAIAPAPIEDPAAGPLQIVRAWLGIVWWELYTIVPGYVAIVLVLGALRAWLFQPHVLVGANGIVATAAAAVVGTLFVIPTGGEVPIVQTFARFGLGVGPAAALLIALPAISLPSMFIARSAFAPRVFLAVGGAVAGAAIVAGVVASALHLSPV